MVKYTDIKYLDKPYTKGRCAFEDGQSRNTNPYEQGSHDWKDWLSGYNNIACRMEG